MKWPQIDYAVLAWVPGDREREREREIERESSCLQGVYDLQNYRKDRNLGERQITQFFHVCKVHIVFPKWLNGKESTCNVGDTGSIPDPGRYPREGNGNPSQYSFFFLTPWIEEHGRLQSTQSQKSQTQLHN